MPTCLSTVVLHLKKQNINWSDWLQEEKLNINGADHVVGEAGGAAGAVFAKHLVQQTAGQSKLLQFPQHKTHKIQKN